MGGGLPDLNNPPTPDQMQAMMNSPMMQAMMDNPEMMRAAMQMSMQQNPQLRALMESNPEMRQMMEDPAMLDQAIQMMRNPAYMQQQMRNQELAMSQLENLPGGFSALSSMYRNYQEPLMDAQVNGGSNSDATTRSNTHSSSSADGATGAAMPNPWGSSSTNNPSGASGGSNSSMPPNPWGMPGGASAGINGDASPWAAALGGGGLPPMPLGMMNPQNMDPDQLMTILDNPMVTQMMQQMVDQNPDMVRQMLEAQNPMLRQLFQSNPEMGNQMVRQMMNPQALRAMLQMQQAMGGGAGMGFPSPPTTSQGGLDFSNLLDGAGGGIPTGTGPTSGSMPQNPMDFTSMMQQLQGMQSFGGMGAPSAPSNQHPADRYRSQLQSLRDMGFDDEQQCLAVLQQNHGNLNRAVDALLMGPPPATATAPVPPSTAASPQTDGSASGSSGSGNSQANGEPAPEPKDATEKKND
jgi:ubiquilin